jgi:hypothetical protein
MSGLVAFDPTEAWIRGIAGTDQLGIKEHLVASCLLAVAIFFQVFFVCATVFCIRIGYKANPDTDLIRSH